MSDVKIPYGTWDDFSDGYNSRPARGLTQSYISGCLVRHGELGKSNEELVELDFMLRALHEMPE